MSSLVNERSWLDIVRSKVPELDEQPNDAREQTRVCDDAAVFCCPNCSAPVGVTDGQQLTAGAIIINSVAELTCIACQRSYTWQPTE